MRRMFILSAAALLLTAGCAVTPDQTAGETEARKRVYRVSNTGSSKVTYRMLDALNALRAASGAAPLNLDTSLTAAARQHSRDMSVQGRPWHFGVDGSSPYDRVQNAGYDATLLGETISESYETELETLTAWMERDDTRAILLNPQADEVGFGWYQEPNGKIWWTLVTGGPVADAAALPQG